MKKCIVIPDSFKGTLSSSEVCAIMKAAILRHYPAAEVVSVPVADGGEGSVDCFLAAVGGEKRPVRVSGPFGKEMDSFYGLLPDGSAVVEMAACCGLPLAGTAGDPLHTTTYGVGQLIQQALNDGAKHIVVGLGGSATNDGGAGAAAALGMRFFDEAGSPFLPTGGTLHRIARIDAAGLDSRLNSVGVVGMCDVENPLCGENGASAIFGPQKGATPDMVALLDAGLAHMAAIAKRDLGADVLELSGAGAAGGMGGGLVAFLGASLQMGIETVLDAVRFDDLLADAELVFSGEGRIDAQSLQGKVVVGVARRAKSAGVPVVAVVGDVKEPIAGAYDTGVQAIFSINRRAVPFSEARLTSRQDLDATMDDLMRYTQIFTLKNET